MTNKTVQAIEKAFCRLLQQTEFKKITVSRLCRDADVSRATFYTYFDGTLSLLREIEDRTLADILQILDGWNYFSFHALGDGETAPVFLDVCRYCYRHRAVFQALFGPYGDLEFVYRYETHMYQDFMRHIQAEGMLRFPDLIASSCAGAVIGLTRTWFADPSLATPEELAQLHTAIVYRIVRSADRFSGVLQPKAQPPKPGAQQPLPDGQSCKGWNWRSRGALFDPKRN